MLLSNVSRGNVLAVAINMLIIASIASLNCLIIQQIIYSNVADGIHYINRDLVRFETIIFIVSITNIVAGLFFVVILMVWLYRAYSNMQTLDNRLTDHKYWAVLGWIAPLFNLIMPYRLFNKMSLSAVDYVKVHTQVSFKRYKPLWLLLIWVNFLLIVLLRVFQYRIAYFVDASIVLNIGIAINVLILVCTLLFASYFNFYRKLEALIYKLNLEEKDDSADCIELVRE